MKITRLLLLILMVSSHAFGGVKEVDYKAVDKKALEIPVKMTGTTNDISAYINASFSTEDDKIRAIFIWVASTLEYDVENMFAINFQEKPEEKIVRVLKTHKGVCANYAALFNELCKKCGILAENVTGYTRQDGVVSTLPHGWCAAKVSGSWFLFDPTWGSGTVNNSKFTRKINNEYFKADPEAMIKMHMPFDPMWQMLHFIVTNKEFTEGKRDPAIRKMNFSYEDSIAVFEKQSELEQNLAAARRIEQNQVTNSMIYDHLARLHTNISYMQENKKVEAQNKIVDKYNDAVALFNSGVEHLNEFINYRNKQFTPAKSDAQIQKMIDVAENELSASEKSVQSLKGANEKIDELAIPLRKTMSDAFRVLEDQKVFLQEYMGRGKLGRKTMFRKYTWMGLPLN